MRQYHAVRIVFLLWSLALFNYGCSSKESGPLPEGFIYLDQVSPEIEIDLRYYSTHNFVGKRIDGYLQPKCILTREAAHALKNVQEELKPFGLDLKVFDAYRPQRAVDHFVRWAKNLEDTRMKGEFYPGVNKEDLFKEDYIAERSGHSRGSAIDLTIVGLEEGKVTTELHMGTGYDFFGPESWPHYSNISSAQRASRALLQVIMTKHGFVPYPKEWWHFTLKNEPFLDQYFDFPIQ